MVDDIYVHYDLDVIVVMNAGAEKACSFGFYGADDYFGRLGVVAYSCCSY